MKKFTGTVQDMMDSRTITYPCPKATRLPFDNIFTKEGHWFYVNSVEDCDNPLLKKQNQTVEHQGEHWLTLRPTTGEIVRHSKHALEHLPKPPAKKKARK